MNNNQDRKILLPVTFGAIAALFVFCFLFFTLTPYIQGRIFSKDAEAGKIEDISKSNFIFSPYTNSQADIRSYFLNFIIKSPAGAPSESFLDGVIVKMKELAEKEANPYYYMLIGMGYDKKAEISKDGSFYGVAEQYYKKAISASACTSRMDATGGKTMPLATNP